MLTVKRLRRTPSHFRAFTGFDPEAFDRLLAELELEYRQREEARHARPNRLRAVGAGHPFHLDLSERLLMGLMYWRLYVTEGLLSYLFDLDESNISRELSQRLLPALSA